jgi:hypothetical protein
MMSASTRLAIVRSGSFILAIAACSIFLPSSLFFCAFSSWAYSFIAARSSAENFPVEEFLGALVRFAVVFFFVLVVFFLVLVVLAAIAVHLRVIVSSKLP